MVKKNQVVGGQAPLSQRAYSAHRGVALSAVQKAIKTGRLSLSLTENAQGHKKIISAEAADNEWKANTRQVPGSDDGPEGLMIVGDDAAEMEETDLGRIKYNEAHRRLEIEKWLREQIKRKGDELDLAKRTGELISIDDARDTVIAEYMEVKTKMLGIPGRAKQLIPELTTAGMDTLKGLIREALEALSNDD